MTGDGKWIFYNNGEWKRSWGKWSKPPPTTPQASLHPKKVMLYTRWNWKGVLYYTLLPENQMINSNKKSSQLDQQEAALDEKHSKLDNRIKQDHMFLWWLGKNYYNLAGKFWFICHIHETLYLRISTYFGLYKILLMEKNFQLPGRLQKAPRTVLCSKI